MLREVKLKEDELPGLNSRVAALRGGSAAPAPVPLRMTTSLNHDLCSHTVSDMVDHSSLSWIVHPDSVALL